MNDKPQTLDENALIVGESITMVPGSIDFPEYARLRYQAETIADFLTHSVVTEENVKANKKALAAVRKQVNNLDSQRIAIKKAYTQPLSTFESQVKEITEIVRSAENVLRSQVKELEDQERIDKMRRIEEVFDQRVGPLLKTQNDRKIFAFSAFFDMKMLNKTVSMNQIEKRLGSWILETTTDVQAISVFNDQEEILEEYLACRNFATAVKVVKERHERIEELRNNRKQNKVEPEPNGVQIEIDSKDWELAKAALDRHNVNYKLI